MAQITLPSGKKKYLGLYDTADEAARVYARKYLELYGGPPEQAVAEHEAACGGSGEGDDMEMHDGRYEAKIRLPSRKNKYLGIYDTAEEAAKVFARKHLELHTPTCEVLGTLAQLQAADGGDGGAEVPGH